MASAAQLGIAAGTAARLSSCYSSNTSRVSSCLSMHGCFVAASTLCKLIQTHRIGENLDARRYSAGSDGRRPQPAAVERRGAPALDGQAALAAAGGLGGSAAAAAAQYPPRGHGAVAAGSRQVQQGRCGFFDHRRSGCRHRRRRKQQCDGLMRRLTGMSAGSCQRDGQHIQRASLGNWLEAPTVECHAVPDGGS